MRRALLIALLLLPLLVGTGAAQMRQESIAKGPGMEPTPGSATLQATAAGLAVSPAFAYEGAPALPSGIDIPFYVTLQNVASERATGTILLAAEGAAAVNRSAIDYDLAPGAYDSWIVSLRLGAGASTFIVEAADVPDARIVMPLHGVEPVGVAIDPVLVSVNVGARELVEYRVNVTNHGAEPTSKTLQLRFREEIVAEHALVPPLEPGETRAVSLGTLRPPPPETVYDEARTDYYSVPWVVAIDGEQTLSLEVSNGTLVRAGQAFGYLRVAFGPTLRIVSDQVALGEPSHVMVRIRHDGDEAIDVGYRIEAMGFALSVHPDWRIDGMSGTLRLQPGASRDLRFEFVPRLATSFEIQAAIYNTQMHISDARRVDLASPVRLSPGDAAWQMRPRVGDTTTWNVTVGTDAPLEDAQLRVAIASRQGWSFEGLVRSDDIATVEVRDAPPPGDLLPGAALHANVSLRTRASGSYLVIPYIQSGGNAYLGSLTDADLERMQQIMRESWEAQQMRSVILVANVLPVPVPPALAFLPAVALLAGTIALWVGRRMVVK